MGSIVQLRSAGFLLGSVEALQSPGPQFSLSLFLWGRAPAFRPSLVLVMVLVLLVLRERTVVCVCVCVCVGGCGCG